MGWYTEQALPRLIDVVMARQEFEAIRARVAAGLAGDVLEVGFGSGLNVPHYPPAVSRVRAIDPATVGRKLAGKRLAACTIPVELVGLDGEDLPLGSGSVDHVLVTWTLCSVAHPDKALEEIARVLRPGGQLHFVEHGLSPDPTVSRWQSRLTPIQRRIAGGCHLDRPIDQLIARSGLRIDEITNSYLTGPRPFGYLTEGVATKV